MTLGSGDTGDRLAPTASKEAALRSASDREVLIIRALYGFAPDLQGLPVNAAARRALLLRHRLRGAFDRLVIGDGEGLAVVLAVDFDHPDLGDGGIAVFSVDRDLRGSLFANILWRPAFGVEGKDQIVRIAHPWH